MVWAIGSAAGEKNFVPFAGEKKLRGDKLLFKKDWGTNNFYQSSAITRSSPTMAKCAEVFLKLHFREKTAKQHAA